MVIEKMYVKVVNKDGRDYLLPDCRNSHLIMKLISGKFFTANDLAILQQIGFKFEAR